MHPPLLAGNCMLVKRRMLICRWQLREMARVLTKVLWRMGKLDIQPSPCNLIGGKLKGRDHAA